jgi:hypothetical protein
MKPREIIVTTTGGIKYTVISGLYANNRYNEYILHRFIKGKSSFHLRIECIIL